MWSTFFSIFLLVMMIIFSIMHPMKMVFLLMIYSLSILYSMMQINPSSMYPYMMFLIMIGGIMILTLYFTSLIIYKNSKHENFLIFMIMMFLIIMSLMYLFYKWIYLTPEINEYLNYVYSNLLKVKYLDIDGDINLKLLYSSNMLLMIIYCITILLMILYFITKISLNMIKSLRVIWNYYE